MRWGPPLLPTTPPQSLHFTSPDEAVWIPSLNHPHLDSRRSREAGEAEAWVPLAYNQGGAPLAPLSPRCCGASLDSTGRPPAPNLTTA